MITNERGTPCETCHGYEHPTVSVHAPVCATLDGTSRTFDRVTVDRLEQWQRAGVRVRRYWLTNERLYHWRGTVAIEALWRACDLHTLPTKHVLTDVVGALCEEVLTNDHAVLALEWLTFNDPTRNQDCWHMYQDVKQVLEGLKLHNSVRYLAEALDWRTRSF